MSDAYKLTRDLLESADISESELDKRLDKEPFELRAATLLYLLACALGETNTKRLKEVCGISDAAAEFLSKHMVVELVLPDIEE